MPEKSKTEEAPWPATVGSESPNPPANRLPGKPVAYNNGLLSINHGLLWSIVACFFGLLGVPGGMQASIFSSSSFLVLGSRTLMSSAPLRCESKETSESVTR